MRTPAAEHYPWIACLAALPVETVGLNPLIREGETGSRSGARWRAGRIHGRKVLRVQTGMGREAAAHETAVILERLPTMAPVSFGFSGAQSASLQAGDPLPCRELKAICHVLGHPSELARLTQFSWAARKVRARLTGFLSAFMQDVVVK